MSGSVNRNKPSYMSFGTSEPALRGRAKENTRARPSPADKFAVLLDEATLVTLHTSIKRVDVAPDRITSGCSLC